MARKNRGRNKKANRAERRAKSIQKKIDKLRKGGGGNRKEARAKVQALKEKRNAALKIARTTRKNIIQSGEIIN